MTIKSFTWKSYTGKTNYQLDYWLPTEVGDVITLRFKREPWSEVVSYIYLNDEFYTKGHKSKYWKI